MQRDLLSLDPVTPKAVAEILRRFGTVALITKAEDERLNAAGYNRKMPDDWDGENPFARYKAVGIVIVENDVG